jgi:hypothetical protein
MEDLVVVEIALGIMLAVILLACLPLLFGLLAVGIVVGIYLLVGAIGFAIIFGLVLLIDGSIQEAALGGLAGAAAAIVLYKVTR